MEKQAEESVEIGADSLENRSKAESLTAVKSKTLQEARVDMLFCYL